MKTRLTLALSLILAGNLQAQTWTGATNTDWGTSTNWNPTTVPTSSSNVTIPGSLSTYPKLGSNVTVANFSMSTGASLNMNGYNLTATGNISMNTATVTSGGTLSKTGSGTIDVRSCTITATTTFSGYTGNCYIYDNTITGDLTISNASTQSGDDYIDGNSVTGAVGITQNSNSSEMREGYNSPSSSSNHFTGNTTFTLAGTNNLVTSYSRATQFTGNVTFAHTGSGLLTAFNTGGTISGNLSMTGNSGNNSINATPTGNVTVGGTVNITISSGAQIFTMMNLKNSTSGGTISVTSPSNVTIQNDTLKAILSVTGYTGTTKVYDNSITGNVTLSSASSQGGDNKIDGNNIVGNLSVTSASNNSPMVEGDGSPTNHANVITGNTTFTTSGSWPFYSSYSRATQFNGNLTVSHGSSNSFTLFRESASVTGDLSITSSSGAGAMQINPLTTAPLPPTVVVGGKINISAAGAANFTMLRVKNTTSGGTISITGPTTVAIEDDTLIAPLTLSGYTNNMIFFDNNLTGNVTIANAVNQSYNNDIDGNNIVGDLTITHATHFGNPMREGYGSPSGNGDKISGNTHITISGTSMFTSGYSHPGTYGGDVTVTHTGSATAQIFHNGASTVGGDFSMTSSWGAGDAYINYNNGPTVQVAGTINILDSTGYSFDMNRIKNNTAGGDIRVIKPAAVVMFYDTVKASVTVLDYSYFSHIFDNNITGNLTVSNVEAQTAENYIDGNNVTGDFSVTQWSKNSTMYLGNGSPHSNGMVVGGNTTINLMGPQLLITCFNNPEHYYGNFTVNHYGGGALYLFNTTASIGGDFTLNDHDTAGATNINGQGMDVIDVGGKVRLIHTGPAALTMRYVRSNTPHDTVSVSGMTGSFYFINDTLSSALLLREMAGSIELYNSQITGETFISDSSTQTGNFKIGGNKFNGSFSLVHKSSNAVYEGVAIGSEDWVTGVDSFVNLTGAGAMYLTSNRLHRADSTFILNSAGNVSFGASYPLYFGGSTIGTVRSYGTQQIVAPQVTIAKTGGANVTLETPLSVTSLLTFTSGHFNSSTNTPLVFTNGASHTGASDGSHVAGTVFKVGNAAFTFPTGDGTYYLPCGISAPGSVTDTFSGEYKNQSPLSAGYDPTKLASTINHVSHLQYWLINRAATTSSNVKVTLSFNPYSGVNNLSALTVAHWYNNGSVTHWFDEGNGSTTGTTTNGTITSNNTVSTFSPFTLASTTSANPLPIHLLEFTVRPNGHTAVVSWRTGSELGDEQYQVQRSNDGQHFETLSTQAAQGSGSSYRYVDPLPAKGLNYYRLAISEPGQPLNYSPTHMLRFDETGAVADEVFIYPNPADADIYADGLSLHKGAVLSLRSITGQVIHQETLHGESRIEVPLQGLPAGTYFLNIDDENGPVYRGRFIRR